MIPASTLLVACMTLVVGSLSEVNGSASHDLRNNCLCHELFELLVDTKAQWKVDMKRVADLERKVEKLEKQNSSPPPRNGHTCKYPISFFARRKASTVVAGGKTVDFTDVITDPCNSFNNITSVFTCTTPGVYVFNFMALDNGDNRLNHLHLMKNDKSITYNWSKGNGRYHEMAGNTAILSLKKGDRVYVRAGPSHPSQPLGNYSTFSGFKINEM